VKPKLVSPAVRRSLVLTGTGTWRVESRGLAQVDADWMAPDLAFFRIWIVVFVYLWTIGLTKAAMGVAKLC
jgi:hypothetical protein